MDGPSRPTDPRTQRWTRAQYMDRVIDHHTYYLSLAYEVGYEYLEACVKAIASPERLGQLLDEGDTSLNKIPLQRWDNFHVGIFHRANTPGVRKYAGAGWSQSESVCVLKAVARHIADSLKFHIGQARLPLTTDGRMRRDDEY